MGIRQFDEADLGQHIEPAFHEGQCTGDQHPRRNAPHQAPHRILQRKGHYESGHIEITECQRLKKQIADGLGQSRQKSDGQDAGSCSDLLYSLDRHKNSEELGQAHRHGIDLRLSLENHQHREDHCRRGDQNCLGRFQQESEHHSQQGNRQQHH